MKDLNKPKKEEKKKEADPQMEVIYQQLEERIKSIVGTKVAIQHKNKNKGKIEIEYYSQAELERLIDLFESIKELFSTLTVTSQNAFLITFGEGILT